MRRLHFVKVFTTDVELELTISSATTGLQLFQQVCETIGIREVWHSGINYVDKYNEIVWLDLTKKVVKQTGGEKGTIYLKLCVKYYPEDVQSELIFETTQRMFYLHVKDSILDGKLLCSFETAILLASYTCQVKFGDYNEETMQPGFLSKEKLIPQRLMDNQDISDVEVENMVVQWYRQHAEMLRSDVMMEYLRIAQELEMYGVTYFSVKNKRGTDLLIGVDAFGLNIYPENDKLTPKMGFPWSEVSAVNFRRLKFIITPVDKKSKDLILISSHIRYNQRLFSLCIGTHELYTRRRRPEPVEVQHMRAQAAADRDQRQRERTRLNTALQAHLEAEKRLQLLTADVASARADQERADQHAMELVKRVNELEEQLREEATLRTELENAQQRLIEHNTQLEEKFAKGEGDRIRFLEEKASIESQIVILKRSVLRSSARVDHQKAAIAQMNKVPKRKSSFSGHPMGSVPPVTDSRERRRKEINKPETTSSHHTKETDMASKRLDHSQEPITEYKPTDNEQTIAPSLSLPQLSEAKCFPNGNDTQASYPIIINRQLEVSPPSEHRQAYSDHFPTAEQNGHAESQFDETKSPIRVLHKSYETIRPVSHPQYDSSQHSIYHELNLTIPSTDYSTGRRTCPGSIYFWKGDGRYETLLKIRHGNTKKRVDLFESM